MYTVVGGGLAGLVAAARIAGAGRPVRLLEPGDVVGGRARTYDTAGDPIERFPGYLTQSNGPLRDVLAAHGIGDRLVDRRGRTARYLDGVVHPVDAPWERLAYPGLGPRNALRLRRLRRRLDASSEEDAGSSGPQSLDDRTVESVVSERGGSALYAEWFEPLLRAEFGGRAGDVPGSWLRERLESRGDRGRGGETVGYIEGSAGVLVDALCETLGDDAIRRNARIVGVERSTADPGTPVTLTLGDDSGLRAIESGGVVLATDPDDLERIAGVDSGVDTVGETCALVTTGESVTDGWRLVFDDDAPFDAAIEHTNLVPPDRYGGDHLLYLIRRDELGSDRRRTVSDPTAGRPASEGSTTGESGDDESCRARWLDALSDSFPGFSRDSVRAFRVVKDPVAAVVPASEAPRSRTVPVDLAAVGLPGVAYAGPGSAADRFGTSMNARVAAGVAAAEVVLSRSSSAEIESA